MIRYFTLFAFLSFHLTVFSQDYHPTKLFVKFKENTSLDNIDYTASKSFSNLPLSSLQKTFVNFQVKSIVKTSKIKKEAFQRIYTLSVADSLKIDQLILELQKFPEIELVERVPVYQTFFTPNDLHPNQWHLPKINALQAWDISTGSTSITVAIVDDAVKIDHEDLQNNIWVNPGEIPNNGIDDDNNGYTDDVNGFDVADWDNDPRPPIFATNSVFTHGTHCAGIAAAVSNNGKGIASIGYSVKIIPVKTKYSSTSDNTLNAPYDGVEYAINAGARVISMSWGGGGYSSVFQSLFDYAHAQGIVIVAAAGNSSSSSPFYPAAYNYVISVGATDNTDHVASFSNYGTTIDIMAPGVNIWSTLAGSTSSYGYFSGTSMACPLVAGSAALILSSQPTLLPLTLENCIKNSADDINALNPAYIGLMGGGRINIYNAIRCASSAIYADFTANNTTICGGTSITFTDLSRGSITGWNWSFPGGSPSSSTLKNPVVSYPANGTYSVTLTSYNGTVSGSITKTTYITVYKPGATLSGNNTIVAGNITYLKIDFNGVAPFSFAVSDGTTIINQSNAYSNPYYLSVSPASTKTYTLTAFSDNNCSGSFTGSAIITLTTASGGGNTNCIPTSGLMAYYPFDGNTNDMSGYGNNGTIMGTGISLTTDRFGNTSSAYDFNGTPQQSIISPMSLRSIIGISFWFKASSLNTNPYPTFYILDDDNILNTGNITPGYFYSTLITRSGLDDLFVRVDKIGDDFNPISSIVSNDVWHHYYCSYDGPNKILKIYLDGILLGSKSLTISGITLNNNFLRLGKSSTIGNNGDQFIGQLDEVRIYNRVLTDCEVAQLYDCNNTCIVPGPCLSTDQLVAYYPFDGNANDYSGNNNHAYTILGATLTTDRFNNPNSAYLFNGGDNVIKIHPSPSLDLTNGVTISLWIYQTGTNCNFGCDDNIPNWGSILVSKALWGGSNGGYHLDVRGQTNVTGHRMRFISGPSVTEANTDHTLNAWHHLVASYDKNTVNYYLDGVPVGSVNSPQSSIGINSYDLSIGGPNSLSVNNTGFNFKGKIDDVKIYSRSFSDCEIAKLYDCNSTCGLVASYPFCGNANDVTGNGNHGTVSGATLGADRFGNLNNAYSFNGINDFISIAGQNFNFNSDMAISVWINPDNTSMDSYAAIFDKSHSHDLYINEKGGWVIERNGSSNQFYYSYQCNTTPGICNNIASSVPYTNTQWQHYVFSKQGPIVKSYLNGILLYSNTFTGSNIAYDDINFPLLIGAERERNSVGPPYLDRYYNGLIDDIKIYNRAITDIEIQALYNEPAPCTTTGLVASYPFCGNANDVSGNGNNGTLTGATLTSDRFGIANSAYLFDGINDKKITAKNDPSLNPQTQISISAWYKAPTSYAGQGNDPLVDKPYYSQNPPYYQYRLGVTGDLRSGLFATFVFNVSLNGNRQYLETNSNTWVPGNWYHVVGVYDGSSIKIYVNGTLNKSASGISGNMDAYNTDLTIGYSSNLSTSKVNGIIDDIKIYDRTLSQQEITALYNAPSPCTTSGIVANYPFCGNPNDITANQLNGTISGNVTLQPDRFNIPNTSYNFGGGFTDVILVDNKSNLLTLQNFSVSFWIKRSRTNIKEDLFLSILGGGWGLYINNVNNLSFTKVDSNQAYSNFTLNDLNWHHCAIVTTNSQTTFYLDGVNSITQPYPRTILGASLYSFGNRYLTNEGFQGQLDDFKICSKLLTDAEVLALFNESPPCNSGPIASYPFCGNTNDVTGNGYNGTISGSTFNTDRFGNAGTSAYFAGGSQCIKIPRPISTDFSIVAWFKTTKVSNHQTSWINGLSIVDAETWGCVKDFGVSLINGGKIAFGVGDPASCNPTSFTSINDYNDGNWHMVVATRSYSTGSLTVYADNILLGSLTSYKNVLNDPPFIGIGRNTGNIIGNAREDSSFVGFIDDVKIYDRVISTAEINALYNAPAPCNSLCTLSITGNNTGCLTQNSIYSVFPSNLNNITWTITGGSFTRLSGNSISINWTSPGSNMVIASETVCGITTSLGVNVTCCTNSNISISGSNTGCLKDSLNSNIYEIDGALPYNFQWIVTGGTFRRIAPNAISVIWTSTGYNFITANQTICGIFTSLGVNVSCCNASSTSILGSTIVCKDSSYIYQTANVSVSDVYNWTISGGTFTTLNNYSVKVVWKSIGSRSLYVYEGQCKTAAFLDVTVNPCGNQPRTITGTNSSCYNSTLSYKVTNTSSSTAFAWIVIGGNYVTSGNNSIVVNWTSIGHNFVSAVDLSSGQTYTFGVDIHCCSNNVPQDALPPISVDFSELDMICNTVGTVALKGGNPPGGFYWYKGIASNYLVVSKGGDFPLIYQYTDQYECTNTVAGVLSVKLCTVPGPCDMAVPPCTCPGYTCPPPFKIYSAITPNGDQFNDYWVMDSLPPDLKVSIMDRWGNLLFHDDHYFNNWDGRSSNGEKLPSGIYYYIVEFEPGKRRYTGTISIIRD